RPAARPMRLPPLPLGATTKRKSGPSRRVPRWNTRRYSAAVLRRSAGRSPPSGPPPTRFYAPILLRPFCRRLLSTRRPPLVSIRTRKPCVLSRFLVLGWNVRFIFWVPLGRSKAPDGPYAHPRKDPSLEKGAVYCQTHPPHWPARTLSQRRPCD